MKVVFLTGHGGNEVVTVGERPQPKRQTGEVLVRLQAATLNRVDLYMRESGAGITHTLPQIMGLEGAGVVEVCRRGDEVMCTAMQLFGEHRDGTLAQVLAVPARNPVPMPPGWTFAQAAALGVNHLTAWRMLMTQARLQPWETVLIFGIGGGVSLAGLQLAKAIGARARGRTRRHPAGRVPAHDFALPHGREVRHSRHHRSA